MTREATIVIQLLTLGMALGAVILFIVCWRLGRGKPAASLLYMLMLVNLVLFISHRLATKLFSFDGAVWTWLDGVVQAFGVNEWSVMLQLQLATTFFVSGLLYLRNGHGHEQRSDH
jgi:hypothetical protein